MSQEFFTFSRLRILQHVMWAANIFFPICGASLDLFNGVFSSGQVQRIYLSFSGLTLRVMSKHSFPGRWLRHPSTCIFLTDRAPRSSFFVSIFMMLISALLLDFRTLQESWNRNQSPTLQKPAPPPRPHLTQLPPTIPQIPTQTGASHLNV